MEVGIEAMNAFCGSAYLNVRKLAEYRKLDTARFDNLLMKEKTVALPYEDPVTYAVNAARPVLESLAPQARERIEMLITCSESGIDFGKSLSTYIHHYLDLNRNCRLFELKQACYAGTAGLQMAINFILSDVSPGAKALVVATDLSRVLIEDITEDATDARFSEWSYAEPSTGAGAVALLISAEPQVFRVDIGANGYYGYEVMDTCRPGIEGEVGDADLSLLSYLDCCEQSFSEYQRRVKGADYGSAFQYLAFHTPFGGMVKGAHRSMMRKTRRAAPDDIEADFSRRVQPGLTYCQRVGNIMGGTVFLSLASLIDRGDFSAPRRIGCFSYGSGCCSEFYSGTVTQQSQLRQRGFGIANHLDTRYELSLDEYERVLSHSHKLKFGTRNVVIDEPSFADLPAVRHHSRHLRLGEIRDYHRKYVWSA